jgi:hypothetical protein
MFFKHHTGRMTRDTIKFLTFKEWMMKICEQILKLDLRRDEKAGTDQL